MVAFPVPLIGVTLVSHAGLGFGRVMVQAPLQLIVKVPFPGTDGMEMDSGVTVTVAVGVGVGVGVGLYSFSPPPSQEVAAKEIIPDATSIAQSLCSLKNFLIFNRF